eukprot:SAG25_NODE_65_length_17663_cov_18.359656_15_plen_48_part_00
MKEEEKQCVALSKGEASSRKLLEAIEAVLTVQNSQFSRKILPGICKM